MGVDKDGSEVTACLTFIPGVLDLYFETATVTARQKSNTFQNRDRIAARYGCVLAHL